MTEPEGTDWSRVMETVRSVGVPLASFGALGETLPSENYPACGVPTVRGAARRYAVVGLRCPDCKQHTEAMTGGWLQVPQLFLAPGFVQNGQ